jgi:hypothetical protein
MPRSATLREHRDRSGALTTFTVSTGWGTTIVFTEGTYYPASGGEESREVDESVVVRAEDLPLLAGRLGVESGEIEDLFTAVVEYARTIGVTSLADARRLLVRLETPYETSRWFSAG